MVDADEIELKFELTEPALAALAGHDAFAAPARTQVLTSTYFDTPDFALRRAGLSLRVRRTAQGWAQTLKAQGLGDVMTRREWTQDLPCQTPDRMALVDTPAAKSLSGHKLVPLFVTEVTREIRRWTQGDACIEVCVDRGRLVRNGRCAPIFELELELVAGDPRSLFDLAQDLAARGRLPPLYLSKAERGYALAGADARARTGGIAGRDPTPELEARRAFQAMGREALAHAARHAARLRRRPHRESVHQIRVGLRRFGAALSVFRDMAQDATLPRVKAEMRWLAGELDAARDLDVFLKESFAPFSPRTPDRAAFAQLGAGLLRARRQAYARAQAAVSSDRCHDFFLSALRWLEVGAWTRDAALTRRTARSTALKAFAPAQLARMSRKVRARGRRLAEMDAEALHRLRIRIKKLRYAVAFLQPSLTDRDDAAAGLEALVTLQHSLGELNDVACAPKLLRRVCEHPAGPERYAAGLIVAAQRARAQNAERTAFKAFTAFDALGAFPV